MAKQHNRLPAVWNDDARMTVLFSPFRDKSLNPSSWNQKMSFWSDLIISDCKACGDVFVDVQTLPCRFQRNGKIPACLDVVVDEMKRYCLQNLVYKCLKSCMHTHTGQVGETR